MGFTEWTDFPTLLVAAYVMAGFATAPIWGGALFLWAVPSARQRRAGRWERRAVAVAVALIPVPLAVYGLLSLAASPV